MKDEVNVATDFLTRLVTSKNESLKPDQVDQFKTVLSETLTNRFKDHWFPEHPSRGQAFRCIRINETQRTDPTLVHVGDTVGIKFSDLVMPLEVTLWIDPGEVSCRFGEHKGSYCVLGAFKDGNKENFVDQINVEELERKSLERAKQASFEMANSRKRKNRFLKYAAQHGTPFSGVDFFTGGTMANGTVYYPQTPGGSMGSKSFTSPVTSSHATHNMQVPASPSVASSPFLSPNRGSYGRMGGGGSGGATGGAGAPYNSNGASGNSPFSGRFARSLHADFNAAGPIGPNSYSNGQPPSDRYHWTKSVKA